MKKRLGIVIFLQLVVNTLFSQYDTLHIIPPVAISYLNNKTELVISTTSTSVVTVNVFKSNGQFLFDTLVVKDYPVRHIVENTVPGVELLTNNSVLLSEGLIVRSDKDIAVNVRDIANDLYLGSMNGNYSLTSKGQKGLGTNFRMIGYRATNLVYGILAVENGTIVNIANNANQQINLNAGESILINSIGLGNNIGTAITSNKKICVTSSANFEAPGGCGDPIADQLIPDELGGRDYLIVKGAGSLTLEQFTIVATQDSTYYSINGGANALLVNAGDFITLSNGVNTFDYKYVLADKPILVAQGSGISCEAGQTILPPLSCTGSKIIQTKDFLGLTYDAYVISHPISVPTLNGVPLTNPVVVNADWNLYKFDETNVLNGADILLESSSYIHCGILQSGNGFSMFAYFSGFQKNNSVDIKLVTSTGTNSLIEGCENAQIIITREDASAEEIISISTIGTALNGEDFELLPIKDTLIRNQYSDTIYINTLFNSPTEGTETIQIVLEYIDHCTGIPYFLDTTLLLTDYFPMVASTIDSINVCDETDNVFSLSSLISNGKPPYSYSWLNGLGSNDTIVQFTSDLVPNLNIYTLYAYDNCNNSISVPFSVYDQCPITVPNVITANNDNVNDFFLIKNLEDYDQVKVLFLNRWGNVVYENEYYDNSFDGKNNNLRELPAGVYFYKVEVVSQKYDYSTSVFGSNVVTGYLTIIE
jgi:gliding motility-associated-like protein